MSKGIYTFLNGFLQAIGIDQDSRGIACHLAKPSWQFTLQCGRAAYKSNRIFHSKKLKNICFRWPRVSSWHELPFVLCKAGATH